MEQILIRRTKLKTCFLRTEFLYGQYSTQKRARKTPFHSHACWQLEGMVKGCAHIETAFISMNIEAGNLFIIPPGCSHRFVYDNTESIFISLKFNLNLCGKYHTDAWEPQMFPGLEFIPCYEILIKSLDKCGDETGTAALISSIEHLTSSVIEKVYFFPKKNEHDPIISRLKWLINRQPQHPVKVNELAKLLRCNKKYIAAHIRDETGMTIKSFIDSERVETAVQALIHSRNTIGEIAFMTGFPDQYTFSRFFKKRKGISPKKFRQKQNSSK